MDDSHYIDVFTTLKKTRIDNIFGEGGYVRLVDCLPRMVPQGRGCDFAIVRNARVSTGNGIKSIEQDTGLVKRLYKDNHTSPFESVSFVFEISCPLFVAIHFIRHRTAKINMFSQRYASIEKQQKDSIPTKPWYTPSPRLQSKNNHQGSSIETIPPYKQFELENLIQQVENHLQEINKLYNQMIEAGMSREIARYCLPESTYTKLYFEMDLNNLLKFFRLRCDEDTQYETRIFAQAMRELIKPLLPMLKEFLV